MTTAVITCGFEEPSKPDTGIDGTGKKSHNYSYNARLEKYHNVLSGLSSNRDDVVLEYHSCTVYRGDLDSLQDEQWLTDNNILFAFEYLEHALLAKEKNHGGVVLLSPSMAFLLRHSEERPEELIKVLPSFSDCSYVFLPINDNHHVTKAGGGSHWSLLVVEVETHKAYYYDTAGCTNQTSAYQTVMQLRDVLLKCFSEPENDLVALKEVSESEKQKSSSEDEKSRSSSSLHLPHIHRPHLHKKKKKEYSLDFIPVETPQQDNVYDCGVFLCEITSYLLRKLLYTKKFDNTVADIKNVEFDAKSGREYLLSVILEQIAGQQQQQHKQQQ